MLSVFALATMGTQAPAEASAPRPAPAATARGTAHVEPACGAAKKGRATCFALRRTDVTASKGLRAAAAAPVGFGPVDLRSAYDLPADGGKGQTIAIVDAFDDPTAEADLAVYREQYGLPACTSADGCFSQVDQRGGTDYPSADEGWSTEISLDLDMVSAAAPYAHILLVEADNTDMENLGAAVDTAVALGAKYVSNSYGSDYRGGGGEDPAETTTLDAHFNHPGVAVVAASGDYAYGVGYPAASPFVTAVGGTSLARDPNSTRGWSESVWNNDSGGPGSGCSAYEPKPAFQKDTGCANRTVADVAAVADPDTGVAVYQTYGGGGWSVIGGTSAASPLIAAVYADAGAPAAGTYPNSYPYAAASALNDVSTGSNGDCAPAYLCTAATGYDGPTGLGTPNGTAAFRMGAHGEISGTVTDATTGKPVGGAIVTAGDQAAHTDSQGGYRLVLPAGDHHLTVEEFGYVTGAADLTVTDGGMQSVSIALKPVPTRIVSGKVADGSGHGWPLYAKITVDGVPGGPVWTNPATGAYTMKLPQGRDYTLHVAATAPGYRALTKAITVGKAAQTVNFPVLADSWADTAPGYWLHLTGTTEPFGATDSAPQGWHVDNAEGTVGGWEFDDPGARGNQTGGDGTFAVVDSDHYGVAGSQDTQLVSPAYDFSGNVSPELAFDTEYQAWDGHTLAVDATADNGRTWTTVWSWTTGEDAGPARIEVPLTGYAGESAVQLRFHYVAQYGLWWEVDNVFVGERGLTPTPGAMLVGTVTDANTGAGVVGAEVTGQDDPAVAATTVATPDDPALGDGFYATFSPDLGRHSLDAAKSRYTSLTKKVQAAADTTVSTDFKLAAGRLTVTPGPISTSVAWGKQTTRKLTIKNTGGAPATVTLGEVSGGFQPAAATKGAPLQRIKGDFSPLSRKPHTAAAPATGPGTTVVGTPAARSPWQIQANYPESISDSAVDSFGGKAYSAYGYAGGDYTADLYALDPVAGSWTRLADARERRSNPVHGFIDGKFYAAGGWSQAGIDATTEIYDPATNSWTTGAAMPEPSAGAGSVVLDGKLYAVGGCETGDCAGATDVSVYDAVDDSWALVAPYPEPIAWESCGAVNHKLYCAGGLDNGAETAHGYVYDPDADTWSAIPDLPAPRWGSSYAASNGLLMISCGVSQGVLDNQGLAYDPAAGSWTALPNSNTATFRGGGGSGFYKVGGQTSPGVSTRTVELLPGYDQQEPTDATWLTESTSRLTVQAGASATVTVTLNSAVPEITQPGDYTARLSFGSDTPYPPQRVPVTLHVDPPATWGEISGHVMGTTASGGTVPLAGASVQIDSWTSSYSLRTAADGSYSLWLDTRSNPLSVIVSKDGYQAVTGTVKLTKGGVVIKDYILKRQ